MDRVQWVGKANLYEGKQPPFRHNTYMPLGDVYYLVCEYYIVQVFENG